MTQIFHITHLTNLVSITATGRLVSDRAAQAIDCVRIGHQHIKDRRLNRRVPLSPGGFVGDYVPFYFAPRSPMLYAINKGAVLGYAGGQAEVVHLVSSAEAIEAADLEWVFTDGHADMPPLTSFYDDLGDLGKIDWSVMNSRYWFDSANHPDRERRRQAEFLVHDFCPWELIGEIGVYNREAAENVHKIMANVVHKPEIRIEAGWYY
ncbi:MAG: DUF4433 domain-containing protein [Candidatus Acidiferrales bacterium]